jgi:putative transposase
MRNSDSRAPTRASAKTCRVTTAAAVRVRPERWHSVILVTRGLRCEQPAGLPIPWCPQDRPRTRDDEDALTAAIVALARKFGRYGYRRITDLLHMAGWEVNAKRVQRIWRAEGLKVPAKQPKRGRLWLADGSCIRLRPERRNHVWACDFVAETTHDGRKLRLLTVIDEYTCLAIRVARHFTSNDMLYVLSELFLEHGVPQHIRSDNGP